MTNLISRLDSENVSLFIIKDGRVLFSSEEGGMKPLIKAVRTFSSNELIDTVVVDRIVGKASALIIAFFRAKEVHGKVMSIRGRGLLKKQHIKINYEKLVPEIMNRSETDICPFEKAVFKIEEPEVGFQTVVKMIENK
jgi:hypothetical protein